MTTSLSRVVLLGSAAVVAFDLLASLASRHFGFSYARASLGSYAIYSGIGFFASRASATNAVGTAALAAGVAGLVDASIGWAISWALGPGRLPEGTQLTITRWLATAILVVGLAAAIGALGAVVGRRSASNVAAARRR